MRDFIKHLILLLVLNQDACAASGGDWFDHITVDGSTSRRSPMSDAESAAGMDSSSERPGLGFYGSSLIEPPRAPESFYEQLKAQKRWWDANKPKFMDADGLLLEKSGLRFCCRDHGFKRTDEEEVSILDSNPYYNECLETIGDSLPQLSLYVFDSKERNIKTFVGKINLYYSDSDHTNFQYARYISPVKRGKGYGTALLSGLRDLFIFWRSLGAPIETLTGEIEVTNTASLASNIKAGFRPIAFVDDPKTTFIPKVICSFYSKCRIPPEVSEYECFPDISFSERMIVITPFLDKYFSEWLEDEFNPLDETHGLLYDKVQKLIMAPTEKEFNDLLASIRLISKVF